jgi:hypothetical protein
MADVLVELGRTDFGRAETVSISPLEDFVASWENPAVGILSPDVEIPAPKAKVLARIRAVSAMVRSKLVASPEALPPSVRPRPSWWTTARRGFAGLSDADCERIWKCFPSLKPFDKRDFERCKELHPEGSFTGREGTYPLPPERANYPALLHGYISVLGSFQLGGLSDFFKKIGKTVTSPMGVSMLGAVAGIIPFGATTGKIASVALGGLTRYTANKYDLDPKAFAAQVASMTSLGASIGNNPLMAQMISKYLGVKYDPKTASDPLALTALLLKGSGQFAALNQLAKGAGKVTGLFGPDGDAFLSLIQKYAGTAALAAGRGDILSSGTAAGIGGATQLGLSRGAESEFPVIPVVIGVGALAGIGIIIAVTRS